MEKPTTVMGVDYAAADLTVRVLTCFDKSTNTWLTFNLSTDMQEIASELFKNPTFVQAISKPIKPLPLWQNPERDSCDRLMIIQKIIHMIRSRKPDPKAGWLQRLPFMAQRFEDKLYRSASSLDEYKDETTLLKRLQKLGDDCREQISQQAKSEQEAKKARLM